MTPSRGILSAAARTAAALAGLAAAFVLLTGETTCVSPSIVQYPPGFDPLERARTRTGIDNREAVIPSQCYTKTEGISNPCYTCHTSLNGRNEMADDDLQREYAFSDFGLQNHWKNLFDDRSAAIAEITDEEALAYVRQNNYDALRRHLESRCDYAGWVPDLRKSGDSARCGVRSRGLRPGRLVVGALCDLSRSWGPSGRRTVRPTTSSFDCLPSSITSAEGHPSREIYKINLAILEAAIATPNTKPLNALDREVEPIDETLAGIDLNGDGAFDRDVTRVARLPETYVGAASDVPVQRFIYPRGTEFLHTVRYVNPGLIDRISMRMKECATRSASFQCRSTSCSGSTPPNTRTRTRAICRSSPAPAKRG